MMVAALNVFLKQSKFKFIFSFLFCNQTIFNKSWSMKQIETQAQKPLHCLLLK